MSMPAMALPSGGAGRSQTVSIDIDSIEVRALLERFERAVGQASLVLFLEGPATKFFHDDIESRFEEEGDAKSGFWQPLRDATIDIRRADGFGDGPINVRTGEFKEFMLSDYDVFGGTMWAEMNVPGSPGDSQTATKLATAQQGSNDNSLGYGPTPARPVLAVSEMDLFALVGLLQIHILEYALAGLI